MSDARERMRQVASERGVPFADAEAVVRAWLEGAAFDLFPRCGAQTVQHACMLSGGHDGDHICACGEDWREPSA